MGPPLPDWRDIWGAVGLGLAAISFAVGTHAAEPATTDAPTGNALDVFQRKEDILFRIGYRLASKNAEFCERTLPSVGLLLHDAAAYGDPGSVRRNFKLAGDIGVQSVAPGSPADFAGIRQNDTLIAISGRDIAQRWKPVKPAWQRAQDLRQALEERLAAHPVEIAWIDQAGTSRTVALTAEPVCATRFELLTSSDKASADGERVLVGENFPGFAYAEDELAAVVAHEMAHNLLGHLAIFETTGRKRSLVRLSERDADRLMPWLLANAGYDPTAAARFMRRWGPRHGGWIFRKRTHDGWDERVEFIEAELAVIAANVAGGTADWQAHFQPELETSLTPD